MKKIFNLILLTAILFSTSCSMKYAITKGYEKIEIAQSAVPHSNPDKISVKKNMPDTATTAAKITNASLPGNYKVTMLKKAKSKTVSYMRHGAPYLYSRKSFERKITEKPATNDKTYDNSSTTGGIVLLVALGIYWIYKAVSAFIAGDAMLGWTILLVPIAAFFLLCLFMYLWQKFGDKINWEIIIVGLILLAWLGIIIGLFLSGEVEGALVFLLVGIVVIYGFYYVFIAGGGFHVIN